MEILFRYIPLSQVVGTSRAVHVCDRTRGLEYYDNICVNLGAGTVARKMQIT